MPTTTTRAVPPPVATSRPVAAAVVVVAVAVCVGALVLAGGAPTDLPPGIPDPGPVVGWGLPAARLAGLLAAILTVGSLLVAAGLGPDDPGSARRALRTARRSGAAWAASGIAAYGLGVAETAGVPLSSLSPGLLSPGAASTSSMAQLAAALLAGVVAAGAGGPGARARARVLLVVALAAALPVPVAGHAAADDTGLAVGGLAVHVGAALVWTGGLAGIVVHLRADRDALAVAVPRFSALALGAYVALTGSGVLAAAAALPLTGQGWEVAWSSGYAGVLAAKLVVVVLLGWVGLQHRRRTLPRVLAGEPRSFLRLAGLELVVMAAGAGLATALSRTPPPPRSVTDHAGTGRPDELSWASLLLSWQPQAVVLLVLGVAVATYLHTRSRVLATGRAWPRHRTGCFLAGSVLAAVALCSGVAVYAPLLLSMHLAQLLVMLLVVPPLLLLGRPAALLEAVPGLDLPAGLRRLLATPATGAVAACVLLTVVHRTPLMALSLGSPWWHLLVLTSAVGCGLALWWPVLAEAGPARPRVVEWTAWLVPVVACLAVLALQLRTSDRLLAAAWFLELRLGWVDPVADQRLAGTVAGLTAVVLAALGCAVAVVATRSPGAPQDDPAHSSSSTRPRRSSAATAP